MQPPSNAEMSHFSFSKKALILDLLHLAQNQRFTRQGIMLLHFIVAKHFQSTSIKYNFSVCLVLVCSLV